PSKNKASFPTRTLEFENRQPGGHWASIDIFSSFKRIQSARSAPAFSAETCIINGSSLWFQLRILTRYSRRRPEKLNKKYLSRLSSFDRTLTAFRTLYS